MRFLYHYYRLHRDSGELVRSEAKVLSVETREASDDERRRLELFHTDRRVIEVRRVRAIDGRPAMHETVLLPAHRFPEFPGADDLPALMYVFYLERYGIHLAMARESLRADAASKLDCRHLGVPAGHPILEIEQTSYDSAHGVVEWRRCRTVTDRFRYVNEVR
jgi:GntR family transcriptional regulator